ncbi:MAG: hypothetical protein WCF90_06730 [Methanomicrobiales archaeon]
MSIAGDVNRIRIMGNPDGRRLRIHNQRQFLRTCPGLLLTPGQRTLGHLPFRNIDADNQLTGDYSGIVAQENLIGLNPYLSPSRNFELFDDPVPWCTGSIGIFFVHGAFFPDHGCSGISCDELLAMSLNSVGIPEPKNPCLALEKSSRLLK